MPTTIVEGLSSYVVRSATEFRAVYTRTGSLSSLNTTNKDSLVAAINEVNTKPTSGGGAVINDSGPSPTAVYSSTKTEALVADGLATKPDINDTSASVSTVYSSSKLEGYVATAISNRPVINDTTPTGTAVYSSSKVENYVATAIANLVDSAPDALNSLRELAEAIQANQSVATGFAAALGLRVAVDSAQAFSAPQKAQGRDNIGAIAAADIGDVTFDYVALFNTTLTA